MPKLTQYQIDLINKRIEAWNRQKTQSFIEHKQFIERYEQERLRKRKWNTILVEERKEIE